MTTCFVPLLAWIVRLWHEKPIVLTLDATSLGNCVVILSISVVDHGIGMLVAWTVLAAGRIRPA